jgi:hypothetical protein
MEYLLGWFVSCEEMVESVCDVRGGYGEDQLIDVLPYASRVTCQQACQSTSMTVSRTLF